MEVKVTITAILTVPENTQFPETGRGLTLPNGDWVKPFIVFEINDDRDLSFSEAAKLGLDLDEIEFQMEQM